MCHLCSVHKCFRRLRRILINGRLGNFNLERFSDCNEVVVLRLGSKVVQG